MFALRPSAPITALAVLCVFAALLPRSHASQLIVDKQNRCRAFGNGTVFDISSVIPWPYQYTSDTDGYEYWLDPCKGYTCNTVHDTACCQHADMTLSCGDAGSAIWVLESDAPALFRLIVPYGAQWRMSSIIFVQDDAVAEPQISHYSEKPSEQYNFVIRGRCVGQARDGRGQLCQY